MPFSGDAQAATEITDLDELMKSKGWGAVFIHDNKRVLFATLTADLCSRVSCKLAPTINFNPQPSENIIDGINEQRESELSQTKQNGGNKSLSCGNYGAASRPQKAESKIPDLTTSRVVMFGSKGEKPQSIENELKVIFTDYFFPVYKDAKGLDRFRGDKSSRSSRFPANDDSLLSNKVVIPCPYVKLSSVPENKNPNKVKAAKYESSCRRYAEELLIRIFAALPYSLSGHIAYENSCKFFKERHNQLPWYESLAFRPLMRGSHGTFLSKTLHDDKNGLFSLGVWQCLLEDKSNAVYLEFYTTTMKWSMKSTTKRICLFNGYIPHKTTTRTGKKYNEGIRVHHSSYNKPEDEYIGALLMSDNHRKKVTVRNK